MPVVAVTIDIKGDRVRVMFPYDRGLVAICRDIPGRWWDIQAKENLFPFSSIGDIVDAFPGAEIAPEARKLLGVAEDNHRVPEAPETSLCDSLPFADKLRPYQKADIEFIKQRQSGALNGLEMGLGKQQPIDALVLTPDGWREIGSIQLGDSVIGSDGRATKVIGVYPQGVRPAYRVTFSDGSSAEAGPEHLWAVMHRKWGNQWEELVLTTEQLRIHPKVIRKDLSRHWLFLPMLSAPVQFEGNEKLPIGAYTMGCLIADGSLSNGTPVVACHTKEYEEISSRCLSEGSNIRKLNQYTPNCMRFNMREVCSVIRELGLDVKSREKFIPRIYLQASPEERISLLQGLMDGDGSCTKTHNKLVYSTVSEQLAKDVQELVEGLGGIASVRSYDRKEKGLEYQVRIRVPQWIQPFSLKRKAERYTPGTHAHPTRTVRSVEHVRDAESVCISVEAEDGLYATEHAILTHNTVEALAIAHLDGAKRVLVICPNTAKFNWRDEVDKWLPGETRVVVDGAKDVRIKQMAGPERFVIINYEGARIHGKDLAKAKWDMVVVDEAHRIKNRKAKQTVAIKSIPARRKLIMSGTPIMNRPDEIWSLLNYMDPRTYASYWRFVDEYCVTRDRMVDGHRWTEIVRYKDLDKLRRRLSSVMVRRRKDEVLKELPPQIHQKVLVELEPDQRKLYDETEEAIYLELTQGKSLVIPNALARMMRLRQVAVDPEMMGAEDYSSAKYKELAALLEDIIYDGHKAIVYSQFQRATIKLKDSIGKKYDAAYIDGKVKGKDREPEIKKFQEDESCKVFIGTIGSCKEAINLTAADYVIFLDQDWVPSNNEQAAARAHRMGQLNTVNVIRLVARDTVEEAMERILARKRDLFRQVIEHDAGRLDLQLTADDIMELLRRPENNLVGNKKKLADKGKGA